MSQKLPFNNVPSIFEVPKDTPRVIHRLTDNPPGLWELSLWVATNSGPTAADVNVIVTANVSGTTAFLVNRFVPMGDAGQPGAPGAPGVRMEAFVAGTEPRARPVAASGPS